MTNQNGAIEVRVERLIPAPPEAVFDGWLDPKVPGTPWNVADKFLLDPKVDGLFFWRMKDACHHYGRFTEMARPHRMEYTWVSPNTLGEESTVHVTFKRQGDGTLMTLLHSGLPDTDDGRGHEEGWNYFLSLFSKEF